jgi:hypothetical protein
MRIWGHLKIIAQFAEQAAHQQMLLLHLLLSNSLPFPFNLESNCVPDFPTGCYEHNNRAYRSTNDASDEPVE